MTIYHKLRVRAPWYDKDEADDIAIYKQKSKSKYLYTLYNYNGKFHVTRYTSIQEVIDAYSEDGGLVSYECMTYTEYKNHLMIKELVG